MNPIVDAMGHICRIVLPIPDKIFYGNPESSVAVCTLSSMSLLRDLSNSQVMDKIAIAGRLLSENKGIDSLVSSVIKNRISTLILCGKDASGHRAGHSLLALYKNGVSSEGRIHDSLSPEPLLAVSVHDIERFQKRVVLIDRIGETDPERITELVNSLS